MSVLQSQLFADYPLMVACIHHTTKTHKPIKVVDPQTKKEVERCSLYPSITCDVHEGMHGDGCDANYTPAMFIVGPDGKLIFGAEAMKGTGSVGATIKKLDEAGQKIGPGMPRAAYESALRDIEQAKKDADADKVDKAVKALKKLGDSKTIPGGFKEGRVKTALEALEAKGKELLEDAKGKRDASPDEAMKAVKKIAEKFKGLHVGKDADDLRKDWEKK